MKQEGSIYTGQLEDGGFGSFHSEPSQVPGALACCHGNTEALGETCCAQSHALRCQAPQNVYREQAPRQEGVRRKGHMPSRQHDGCDDLSRSCPTSKFYSADKEHLLPPRALS